MIHLIGAKWMELVFYCNFVGEGIVQVDVCISKLYRRIMNS